MTHPLPSRAPKRGRARLRHLLRFLGAALILPCLANCHAQQAPAAPPDAVHIDAKHAIIHIDDQSTVLVDHMTGWMIPTAKKAVSLDDPHSFHMRIDGGETSITAADLTRLFNQQILPTAITPIRSVQCSFEHGRVIFRGTARRMVNVNFIVESTIRADREGHLLIHAESVRGGGWFSDHLMRAMNMRPESMMKPGPHARFRVSPEGLDLPLSALFPPPIVDGHVQSVRITSDRMIQSFGPTDTRNPPPTAAPAYIYFRGGTMQFGKLTMKDVDLELIDKDNAPQVNFSVAHYYHQLESGYSKAMPNRGLLVYMGAGKAFASAAR